ncbi:hypothetical protein N665_0219s0013 [Sinapis alba]|nr:hypothetical protein N665_0219s0013 [Sinapis alba]KAF8100635.1 hypothetical protein N665_0219s0013 [Sinapis alba]
MYDGNMAKVVEGHQMYLGFRKTVLLDRKRLLQLLDLHHNKHVGSVCTSSQGSP